MNPTLGHIKFKFDQIDGRDYHGIIRFYEENSALIFSLDRQPQYFFLYQYVIALFNIGMYEKVLLEIDSLIEYVFYENINFNRENSFEVLIFKKAAANLNTSRYDEAVRLTRELIGINPGNKDYADLMLRTLRARERKGSNQVRLTSLMLILISSVLSALIWTLKDNLTSFNLMLMFYVSLGMNLVAIFLFGKIYISREIKSRKILKRILTNL